MSEEEVAGSEAVAQQTPRREQSLDATSPLDIATQEKYKGVVATFTIDAENGQQVDIAVVAPFRLGKEDFTGQFLSSQYPQYSMSLREATGGSESDLMATKEYGMYQQGDNPEAAAFWGKVHGNLVFVDQDKDGDPDPFVRAYTLKRSNGQEKGISIKVDPNLYDSEELTSFLDSAVEASNQPPGSSNNPFATSSSK